MSHMAFMVDRLAALVFIAVAATGCDASSPTPPGPPQELGSFTMTVTGALNGAVHLTALPLFDNADAHRDFIGMHEKLAANDFYSIEVIKASSVLGPSDGWDLAGVEINRLITSPGMYLNNSCVSRTGGPAACVGMFYDISRHIETGVYSSAGSLSNIQDNRDTVWIEQIDSTKIKMSISGPFTWERPDSTGGGFLRDEVFVRSSFEAYQMRR